MKIIINIFFLIVILYSNSFSQTNSEVIYDSLKAKKYGADDYGMKKYVMAFHHCTSPEKKACQMSRS